MKTPPLSRLDLHRLLDSGSFDHAAILTYTFDPIFFEEYCLADLEGLHNCKTISVILDRSIYDKIIAGSHTKRPKQANLRYLLHPVAVPCVFHPKLVLLTTANKGRLLIGSANFTRPGLTANAELVGVFDFKLNEKEGFAPVLQSAFAFIKAIAERWPGRNLVSNLQGMLRESPWLEGHEQEHEKIELLTNLGTPLLTQLLSKAGGTMTSISIVSRYFDEGMNVLEQLVQRTGAPKIRIFTQNRYTNLHPSWLEHQLVRSGRVELYLSDFSSDDRDQPLHGKAFAFSTDKGCLFAYGSANCTTPALLRSVNSSNLEAVLAVRMSSREAKVLVPRLVDPRMRAERLLKADQLISVPAAPDDICVKGLPIEIIEAEADKERILVWLARPLDQAGLHARIDFSVEKYVKIPIKEIGNSELLIPVDPEITRRLGQRSAVISFEDHGGTAQSNRVLITNLLDVQTGMNARKARYVREAEENTAGLLSVLYALRSGIDEDALRTFLTFCDIPLTMGPRPRWGSLSKEAGASHEWMRNLGQHNFTVALNLHELALKFCERHFRKLRRHISDRHPDGIPNFLHIALAIGGVLESQVDRALTGLEARDFVTPAEWGDFRSICDVYFAIYRELTIALWDSYLSKLVREFPAQRIREAFEPELQPITDLVDRIMGFRARVESLRTTKCLMVGRQKSVPYDYFQSVFSDQRWSQYSRGIQTTQSTMVAAVHLGAVMSKPTRPRSIV